MSALAECKCEVRRRCPRKWLGSEHTDHALCAPPCSGAKTTDRVESSQQLTLGDTEEQPTGDFPSRVFIEYLIIYRRGINRNSG